MVVHFIISIFINIGMWFRALSRSIVTLAPTATFLAVVVGHVTARHFWEYATLAGSFGLFFTMFCLFARLLAGGGDVGSEGACCRRRIRIPITRHTSRKHGRRAPATEGAH